MTPLDLFAPWAKLFLTTECFDRQVFYKIVKGATRLRTRRRRNDRCHDSASQRPRHAGAPLTAKMIRRPTEASAQGHFSPVVLQRLRRQLIPDGFRARRTLVTAEPARRGPSSHKGPALTRARISISSAARRAATTHSRAAPRSNGRQRPTAEPGLKLRPHRSSSIDTLLRQHNPAKFDLIGPNPLAFCNADS
jgi:hypothetical protein